MIPTLSITEPEKRQLLSIALVALIAIAIAIAYANSYYTAFLFDDADAITDNPGIRQLWPIHIPEQSPLAGRPVVAFTFAVNYRISGLGPWSYHLVNLILHIANAWLLFGILRRSHVRDWAAAAIVLLWALHPLNTEAVTYLTQRTELMAALFLELTLYCAIRSASTPRAQVWNTIAIASAAIGSGAKEILVAAPLVVMAYDWTILHRRRRGLYAGLFATWILVGATIVLGSRSQTVGLGLSIGPWDYLKTQSAVLVHYLRLAIWPHPLLIDYSDWPIATRLTSVLPQAAIVVGLLAATGWALYKRSVFGFLGVWFFVILAPTSSIVPIITEPAAERRMYLPLMAVIVAIVYALGRPQLRRYERVTVVGILVVVFGRMTHERNRDYRSEIAMWTDVVNKRPENGRAHGSLGLALYSQRRVDEALPHLIEDARRNPNLADAHFNLGAAYLYLKRADEAESEYGVAARLDPHLEPPRMQLNRLRRQQQ